MGESLYSILSCISKLVLIQHIFSYYIFSLFDEHFRLLKSALRDFSFSSICCMSASYSLLIAFIKRTVKSFFSVIYHMYYKV